MNRTFQYFFKPYLGSKGWVKNNIFFLTARHVLCYDLFPWVLVCFIWQWREHLNLWTRFFFFWKVVIFWFCLGLGFCSVWMEGGGGLKGVSAFHGRFWKNKFHNVELSVSQLIWSEQMGIQIHTTDVMWISAHIISCVSVTGH